MTSIHNTFGPSMLIDGTNLVPNGGFWNNSNPIKSNHIPINYNVKSKTVDLPSNGGLASVAHDSMANSSTSKISSDTRNDPSSSNSLYNCDGLSVDDRVFCLSGPLLTLSNYYATPIFIKNKRYRSVEHYVYEKFVRFLHLSGKFVEKITTTSDPAKLPSVALKFIPRQRFGQLTDNEMSKIAIWYDRAIRKKLRTYDILKQLLLSTGDALLIETNNYQYDAITTIGVSEQEVHLLLTRLEVNNGTLLQHFGQKLNCLELPLPLRKSFTNLGLNLTGTILMRLRTCMQNSRVPAPLPSLLEWNNLEFSELSKSIFVSSSITCFTDDSVFHPKYSSPFWVAEDPYLIYPTVNHYVYIEAAKFFCFPNTFIDSLMRCPADEVLKTFYAELHRRYPDPVKYHIWQNQVFQQSLLKGCRAKFQLHSDLLRCILDTGESLLVYCHRYSTSTCEISIGMREFELREWMRHTGLTSMDLMTYMTIDPCHRPPFLGANRLGCILMSLRQEFKTKAINLFSELTSRPDIVFGEYSGLETGDDFDSNDTHPSMLLWPNPYVSMIKMQNKRLWYPKKRRLPGYYVNGQEIESKKRNLHTAYMPHPEYAFDVIRNFPIPPDVIEHNSDKPYVLIDMICRLSQDAAKYTETIKHQENELGLLLEELHERNDVELKYGPIIKFEKNFDQNGEQSLLNNLSVNSPKPDEKFVKQEVSDVSESDDKKFDLESKLTLIKSSFENYFHQKSAGNVNDDQLFRSVFDSNNSPKFDETKIKAIIDRLYRHLDEQQKLGALNWLTHAVYRMRQLHVVASRNDEGKLLSDPTEKISTADVQQTHRLFVAKMPIVHEKMKITISHSSLSEQDGLPSIPPMADQAEQTNSHIRSCLCATKNVQSQFLIGDQEDMIKNLDSILNQLNQLRDVEKVNLSGTCFESVKSNIKSKLSARISGEIYDLICILLKYLDDLEIKFRKLQYTYSILCLHTQNMFEKGALDDKNLRSNPVNRSNLTDFLSLLDGLILTVDESINQRRSFLIHDFSSTDEMIEKCEQLRKIWKNRYRFMQKFNVIYSKFVDY